MELANDFNHLVALITTRYNLIVSQGKNQAAKDRINYGILEGKKFLDEIMGEERDPKKNPFEMVSVEKNVSQDTTNLQNIAEQLIKRICRLKMNAVAHQKGDRYDVYLTIGTEAKIEGARIRPLSSNKESLLVTLKKGKASYFLVAKMKLIEIQGFIVASKK